MDRWADLLLGPEYVSLAGMPFLVARAATAAMIEETILGLPPKVLRLLPDLREIDRIPPAAELADELDARYFEFDEKGDAIEAQCAFSGARILSACAFFQSATNISDLMEAIYEAKHAKTAELGSKT